MAGDLDHFFDLLEPGAGIPGAENLGEIYVMNADGSGKTQLTKNGSGDFDPTWTPDGPSPAIVVPSADFTVLIVISSTLLWELDRTVLKENWTV